jgi:hypothetical protein
MGKHCIIINHTDESVSSVTSGARLGSRDQLLCIFCPNNYKLQKKLQLSIKHVTAFINGEWQAHDYNKKKLPLKLI